MVSACMQCTSSVAAGQAATTLSLVLSCDKSGSLDGHEYYPESGSPVGSGSVCTKKPIATTTYEHTRMKPRSQCD